MTLLKVSNRVYCTLAFTYITNPPGRERERETKREREGEREEKRQIKKSHRSSMIYIQREGTWMKVTVDASPSSYPTILHILPSTVSHCLCFQSPLLSVYRYCHWSSYIFLLLYRPLYREAIMIPMLLSTYHQNYPSLPWCAWKY